MKCIYNPKSYAKAIACIKARSVRISDYRWASAKKRKATTIDAIRLDDCMKTEYGKDCENAFLSDNGKGAADIRNCGEDYSDESSDWFKEFHNAVDTLNDTEKKIVFALLRDLRPQAAARLANTNRMRVYRTIEKLRGTFATAYSLWRQHQK